MAQSNEKFYRNLGNLDPRHEPNYDVRIEARNRYKNGTKDGVLISLEHSESIPGAGFKSSELYISLDSKEAFRLLNDLLKCFDPK